MFPSAEPADPSVVLLATLGYRFWSRDLTVESDEASGYVEDWTHVYSRFGARYRTRKPDGVNWYGEFSLLVPWQTENDVDGGLSLEPDGNIGWSIDLGVEKGSWSLSLSWVQQTWDVSDAQRALGIDAAGNIFPIQVFQPASDENRIGLRISYRF